MKKIISSAVLFLICFSLAAGAFSNPAVTDKAGLLTESERELVTGKLEELRNGYNIDVAIYTEIAMSGNNAESSADDIFDYGGYGPDGIMLYICMEERVYHITTAGSGINLFTDRSIDTIKYAVESCLKEGQWYGAFDAFASSVSGILGGGSAEGYEESNTGIILILLLLPLVIAFIAMLIKSSRMNTAVKQDSASDYMNSGSFKLETSKDIFLYTTITKTEKPKSDSSSVHTSSSGNSHGGGGGSF